MELDTRLLSYYEKELLFLRQMGTSFAAQHPKVANRLGISGNTSPDPHVERLVESFAFLTGYLQKDIDDQFPRLSSTLLEILYPQLIAPLPPMSIAKITLDPSKGTSTTGYPLAKNFPLFATAPTGENCRFRTSYDITLWPLEVQSAALMPLNLFSLPPTFSAYPFVLKIDINTQGLPLHGLDIKTLQFYINSDTISGHRFFEGLFLDETLKIAVLNPETGETYVTPPGSIGKVGFAPGENVLPDFPQSLPAYRLMQEFFAFPNKFLFFNLNNLQFQHTAQTATLLIPLAIQEENKVNKLPVTQDTFQLGCTPVINLFPKVTDPLNFDKKTIEYPIYGDIRKDTTTEIHSLEKVMGFEPNSPQGYEIAPYFSYTHPSIENQQTRYWNLRRVPQKPGIPGNRMLLSFVNLDFSPTSPPSETIYGHALCTNRDLARFLRSNSVLEADRQLPSKKIILLHQPTPPVYPDLSGAAQWKLVSQLSLDYLSLTNDTLGIEKLQEIINLYRSSIAETLPTSLTRLTTLSTACLVRRLGKDAWRGMVEGIGVNIGLNDHSFETHEALLFSAVLHQFLSLYAPANSFVELSIQRNNTQGNWKTWQPQAGERFLL